MYPKFLFDCLKRDEFSKACILSPLEGNNKGHKTNSHNEIDFS